MGRDIYLVANFKESQVGKMTAGQTVTFTVDAFGSHEFTGRVAALLQAPVHNSHCCRRKTPLATSPKWFSACR
jgi:multidrug resistance efflux pump